MTRWRIAATLCVPGLLLAHQSTPARTAPPQAQCPVLGPGAPSLDVGFLGPYVRETRQIVTDGSGTVINARARWRDELRETDFRGTRAWQRIITMFRFDGATYALDTAYFERGSLAPLMNVEWVTGTLVWRRDYAADRRRVTGQRMQAAPGSGVGAAPDSSRRLDVPLSTPVFDFFGGMDAIVSAAIPLQVGESTCVRSYMPAGDTVGVLTLRVLRREPVEAGRGRFAEAFVVETNGLNGTLRLWVTKVAPFILRSEETVLRDGRPWRIYTTVMID